MLKHYSQLPIQGQLPVVLLLALPEALVLALVLGL